MAKYWYWTIVQFAHNKTHKLDLDIEANSYEEAKKKAKQLANKQYPNRKIWRITFLGKEKL